MNPAVMFYWPPQTFDAPPAPDTWRGVRVPADLKPNWDQPEALWWRMGVIAAQWAPGDSKTDDPEADDGATIIRSVN